MTLRDLEHIDDQVYRNLAELLDFDDVSMLYLEFVVTEDKLGGTTSQYLCTVCMYVWINVCMYVCMYMYTSTTTTNCYILLYKLPGFHLRCKLCVRN